MLHTRNFVCTKTLKKLEGTLLCRPVSDLASCQALRSSARCELLLPRAYSTQKSVELSLLLAPPLGMNSLLRCACCPGTMCVLSASFRHFSLAVAGLRAPLSRFIEGALYKYLEWMMKPFYDHSGSWINEKSTFSLLGGWMKNLKCEWKWDWCK